MNFCLQKIEEGHEEFIVLKDKGINGLERRHGSQYLTLFFRGTTKRNSRVL
ncbi:hypothetical protein ACT7DL_32640 [Bacillus paranthracis]